MVEKKDMITMNIFETLHVHLKELEGIGIQNPIEHMKGMLDSLRVPRHTLYDEDDQHGDNIEF